LSPKVLLDGHWVISSALDRRVVRNDYDFATVYAPYTGDYARSGCFIAIQAEGGQWGEFEKG
jgi:hypothetical protein